MKKILSFLLSLVLLTGLLSGCGGSGDAGSGDAPMGRYIEEQGAQIESLASTSGLRRDESGELMFYGMLIDPETNLSSWHRYRLPVGGEFQIDDPAGFAEISKNGLRSVSEHADGTIYVLYNDEAFGYHLAVSRGGGAFVEIAIAELAAPDTVSVTDGFAAVGAAGASAEISLDGKSEPQLIPTGILALDNGEFLLCYGTDGAARYSADGNRLTEYAGWTFDANLVVNGETLLIYAPNYTEIWSYELATGKKTGVVSYDNLGFSTALVADADGLYLADTTGIYRQAPGGTIWEKLVEGELSSLSMPNLYITGLTSDGSGGFYSILSDQKSGQLMHYVYSAETPTNPDTELTIFSLHENNTVRQAIGEFQRRNPNVRVNFRIGLEEESAATAQDVIRTLNTEFLSGNGPDLLVLDGLPVESYIQKGVLLDITELIGGMDDLMGNLMGAFTHDGKIYGAPSRFTFPYMLGKSADVAQITSLDALTARVVKDQGGTPPFLHPSAKLWDENESGILMEYYDVGASAWRKPDGGIDQAALTAYLTGAASVNAAMREHTPQTDGQAAMMTSAVIGGMGAGYEEVDFGPSDLKAGKALFHTQVLSGLFSLKACVDILATMDDMRIDSLFGQKIYFPKGAVAVTAGTKQQALALSFMEMLLSPTVQDNYLYDGYPVNRTSLEKLLVDELKDKGTGDMGFLALCDSLNTPSISDQVVKEVVQSQMKDLLAGTRTPEQTAQAIVEKTQLYLAE